MTTYVTLDYANSVYRTDYLPAKCHRCGDKTLDRDQDGSVTDEYCASCGKGHATEVRTNLATTNLATFVDIVRLADPSTISEQGLP